MAASILQLVIKTDPIEIETVEEVEEEEGTLSFWQKLLRLFGLTVRLFESKKELRLKFSALALSIYSIVTFFIT